MDDQASRGSARKILLVEDEEFLRRIFKSRMVSEGYTVTDMGDAESALAWLETSQTDLVILDLYLPKMSGFEFLERLKANPARRNIPVMILSGLGQGADMRKGLALGAQEFVVKTNVEPRELLAKIRKLLDAGTQASAEETSAPPAKP